MIATIIIIFFVLSIFHFAYQSIILPSLRLEIRFKLFKLRDELRRLKCSYDDRLNDKLMSNLQLSLNLVIKNLHTIDFATIYDAQIFLKNNPELLKNINEKRQMVENCEIQEVKDIYKESVKLFLLTIGANSGGWIIYIIPIIIVALLFNSIKGLVKKLIFVPEHNLDKIISDHDIALT